MSQYAPGSFASQKEKDCAAKTGYKFIEVMIDPTGNLTNSPLVRQAYEDCIASKGKSIQVESFFTSKNIIISLLVIAIIIAGFKLAKK